MPSVSRHQQQAAAIALHSPEKLKKRNKGLKKMSKEDLKHLAETKHKGLPEKKRKIRVVKTPTGAITKKSFDKVK